MPRLIVRSRLGSRQQEAMLLQYTAFFGTRVLVYVYVTPRGTDFFLLRDGFFSSPEVHQPIQHLFVAVVLSAAVILGVIARDQVFQAKSIAKSTPHRLQRSGVQG